MCTVIGYVGSKSSRSYIFEGLARLEYRGYDSAGFVCFDKEQAAFQYIKTTGGVDNLSAKMDKNPFDGQVGLGHTRWATHGVSTELNAHPHFNSHKTIMLVHNGIIENFSALKKNLLDAGHTFYSDTDTEVLVHIFEEEYLKNKELCSALVATMQRLQGAYACALMLIDKPDFLVAIRKGSPLCIGVGRDEMFVASDAAAFVGRTKKVVFLPDASFALITQDGFHVYDFFGKELVPIIQELDASDVDCNKGVYEHYMLKEIGEQKRIIQDTVAYCHRLNDQVNNQSQDFWTLCGLKASDIQDIKTIDFFACGTSAHAAQIASFFFEQIAKVRSSVFLASEARYRLLSGGPEALFCAISQSGETADTLEIVRMLTAHHGSVLAITNIATSSIVRESQAFLLTQAKKEVSVAATKSFTAQVVLLFWLAHRIAVEKKLLTDSDLQAAQLDLLIAAEVLEDSMERYKRSIIDQYAPRYAAYKNFIFLGRQISFPFACEAALKLKEIAYCFVDCYPAGELKHGPLALVDEHTPLVIFSVLDEMVYQKIVSAAQEIKARRGHLVVFAFEGQHELIDLADTYFIIPKVNPLLAPVAMTGLMQLFVYHIAHVLERPIDRPRNLAKSVTVE